MKLHFIACPLLRFRFNTWVTDGYTSERERVWLMPWKEIEAMDQRIEFAMKAMSSDDFAGLCREYGISRKTGYKWRERFLSYGISGMAEQSRKPLSHAH